MAHSGKTITFATDLLPQENNTYYLGSTTQQWNIYGNLANTLPVAQGGTGSTSFTANSIIISGSTTTSALTTRAITNNTSAAAIITGTSIPTMNTLYYGLPQINNSKNYNSTSGIYAPTTSGTATYILTASGGTAAPVWQGGLTLSGTAAASWKATFNGTTTATSTTVAAVTIAGGLGVADKAYIGNETHAPKFVVDSHVTLQWNSSDSSLDFVFA